MTLWGERAALPCPGCSDDVGGGALLCSHDYDPVCLACCLKQHPARCPECRGTRALITGRDDAGFPITITCPRCNGIGQVNTPETP